MSAKIRFRCQCGKVAGLIDTGGMTCRGSCYCMDCQAYARFLGDPKRVLDAAGGSEIVGIGPSRLEFTTGLGHVDCMTLTSRGPYRWFASCCRTPIGNTPRDPRSSYVSVFRCALVSPAREIDAMFGQPTFRFSTKTATGPVEATRLAMALVILKVVAMLVGRRISGRWRGNPFFEPDTHLPIRMPDELSRTSRFKLRGDIRRD